LAGLIAISAALGSNGLLLLFTLYLDGLHPIGFKFATGAVASLIALIVWIVVRRWHDRRRFIVRWMLGAAWWVLPLASAILLARVAMESAG
jgi:hypothetical protein